jgi:hypothetical protein
MIREGCDDVFSTKLRDKTYAKYIKPGGWVGKCKNWISASFLVKCRKRIVKMDFKGGMTCHLGE